MEVQLLREVERVELWAAKLELIRQDQKSFPSSKLLLAVVMVGCCLERVD